MDNQSLEITSKAGCKVALVALALGILFLGVTITVVAASAQTITPQPQCSQPLKLVSCTSNQCTEIGELISCTGDLSEGVSVDLGNSSTHTFLSVTDLTADITPESGVRGIEFYSKGDITLNSDTGDQAITTQSDHGIRAVSLGGGSVAVDHRGTISTTGISSYGISASSHGAGTVTVKQSGIITVAGGYSHGISGYSEGGDISIELTNSDITASLSDGVSFNDGATNTLILHETVTITGGYYDDVYGGYEDVYGEDGDEAVHNYGLFTNPGIMNLSGGTNSFHNHEGALYNAGTMVILGAGNLFTNEGTLSPGGEGAIGTTFISGNYTQASTGVFLVTIDGTDSDLLEISGSAALSGTVTVSGSPLYGQTYTILTAGGGLTGTFDALTGSLFVDNVLSYDASNVYLTSSIARSFCDVAATANQKAVACVLDDLAVDHEVVEAVLELTSEDEARHAFRALSGEVHPSLKAALMENSQKTVAAINNRLHGAWPATGTLSDTGVSTAAFGDLMDGNNGLWMSGYGSWANIDATGNTAQTDNNLGGVLLGLDRQAGQHWRLGLAGGYGETDLSSTDLSFTGKAHTWSVGGYGGWQHERSRLSFGALYNWHDIKTSRLVSFGKFSQSLVADYSAHSFQAFAEAGHRIETPIMTLEPFAGISYIKLHTDGFKESGGRAAVSASSGTGDATFTTLGVRSAVSLNQQIRATGMAGWRHAFEGVDQASVFTFSGSAPFTILGAPIAEDAFIAELGIEARLSQAFMLEATYAGQYGSHTTENGFNAQMMVWF
ncbi:autotransporter domain-containing protein [Nitratireductor sp. XY-223]|uniref:autotransporter family protein n=1 Tax=Nitratireductor sp. XY-223 TaxID=2561926 RepID=UPI0010AA50D4|nr:autotransporter domain-containing protein [Nitratireductor sp. XY-223]